MGVKSEEVRGGFSHAVFFQSIRCQRLSIYLRERAGEESFCISLNLYS